VLYVVICEEVVVFYRFGATLADTESRTVWLLVHVIARAKTSVIVLAVGNAVAAVVYTPPLNSQALSIHEAFAEPGLQ
jgi:hypothetical protein